MEYSTYLEGTFSLLNLDNPRVINTVYRVVRLLLNIGGQVRLVRLFCLVRYLYIYIYILSAAVSIYTYMYGKRVYIFNIYIRKKELLENCKFCLFAVNGIKNAELPLLAANGSLFTLFSKR